MEVFQDEETDIWRFIIYLRLHRWLSLYTWNMFSLFCVNYVSAKVLQTEFSHTHKSEWLSGQPASRRFPDGMGLGPSDAPRPRGFLLAGDRAAGGGAAHTLGMWCHRPQSLSEWERLLLIIPFQRIQLHFLSYHDSQETPIPKMSLMSHANLVHQVTRGVPSLPFQV